MNLEVRRGEAVGVVGSNGSGKSTLLLALAGIIQPSEGVVEVSGHVSTLLSLQAGFDSDLSGRENIALAGALMGIDHKVMDEITPSIISFADIGAFIDAPMKTYSSGMRARVGFSIATAVDPDILLLDEVLQTGDNKFKQKSRRRIAEVLRSAKAVVMVTHDMSWITAFCTRAILLDRGRIVAEGDPVEIAEMHEESADARRKAERKKKQAIKRGAAPATNVRKARRERTIEELAVGVVGAPATAPSDRRRRTAAIRARRRQRDGSIGGRDYRPRCRVPETCEARHGRSRSRAPALAREARRAAGRGRDVAIARDAHRLRTAAEPPTGPCHAGANARGAGPDGRRPARRALVRSHLTAQTRSSAPPSARRPAAAPASPRRGRA